MKTETLNKLHLHSGHDMLKVVDKRIAELEKELELLQRRRQWLADTLDEIHKFVEGEVKKTRVKKTPKAHQFQRAVKKTAKKKKTVAPPVGDGDEKKGLSKRQRIVNVVKHLSSAVLHRPVMPFEVVNYVLNTAESGNKEMIELLNDLGGETLIKSRLAVAMVDAKNRGELTKEEKGYA